MTNLSPFHLAIPVSDLAASRAFYGQTLGCPEGRSAATWVDFDFFGHQLVVHLAGEGGEQGLASAQPVDGDHVPVPHFGVVLHLDDWQVLVDRLTKAGVRFELEPRRRFVGQPGEQATLFLRDPSGNALEFKGFRDIDAALFAR
ncbi:VOC family protein [uncultured Abyssibacter sp.]|uniref:VOC family protein n=1 Tax=uncultured Abyssibacter sp. TaxID=2320202 RepID=UPI0032B27B35